MAERTSSAVQTARDYYNSSDADNFYFHIWGGEDIHIGLYNSDSESVFDASRRTVDRMASKIPELDENTRLLDIGAGYGGAARYLARKFGCPVTCLNLSEVENDRNRRMNQQQGLDDKIEVVDGSFEQVPFEDESFDVIWSQDAILHSGNREKVIQEVARLLKPGGHFVFTDPMMDDDCPEGVLQPILDRIHLQALGSPGFYSRVCDKAGLALKEFEDHSHQLPRHYGRILRETQANQQQLRQKDVSQDYIDRMKTGLKNWVNGGNDGHLAWGIFHFTK